MAARKRGNFEPDTPRHIKLKRYRQEAGQELRQSPIISMMVVSNGYGKSPKSIVIRTDHRHYLFGCGEGTQRILMELSTRFLKINQVLLTNSTWDQAGGLVGLSISLESAGLDELTLHAPFKIKEWLETCRTIEGFRNLHVAEHLYDKDSHFHDEQFTIRQIRLPSPIDDTIDKPTDISTLHEGNRCIYIVDSKPLPPKLAIEKCVLHGVPANHLRRQLKDGKSITLENGRVIKPEDVLVPGYPEVRILILDVDSQPKSLDFQNKMELIMKELKDRIPDYVVHFTPAELQNSIEYKDKMNEVFRNSRHVCLNERESNVESNGIYKMQIKLNSVHPDFFPLFPNQQREIDLGNKQFRKSDALNNRSTNVEENNSTNSVNAFPFHAGYRTSDSALCATTGININVRTENFQTNDAFQLHLPNVESNISESLNRQSNDNKVYESSVGRSQKIINTNPSLYPHIVFLGTGSACPSTLRNVSSILVRISEECSILFDCGEGTLSQLSRIYSDQLDDVVRTIKIVFISHMHPDHHQGLCGILQLWDRVSEEEKMMTITCPSNLINIIKSSMTTFQQDRICTITDNTNFNANQTIIKNNRINIFRNGIIANRHFTGKQHNNNIQLMQSLANCNLEDYLPVMVDHIYDSHALVINHKDGWKLVYSGDCRPSNELIIAGMNADILIHEATLEDGMEEEAKIVRHCTFSEALGVSRKMQAKCTLLWHFSQRYNKVPSLTMDEMHKGNVAITFDNMFVPFSRVDEVCKLLHPLRHTFSAEFDLLLQKRLKSTALKKQNAQSELSDDRENKA